MPFVTGPDALAPGTTPLWEIDPVSEDAGNTPLTLVGPVGNVTFRLTEMDLTPPEIAAIYASSADTEGDPFIDSRRLNRTVSLTFIAQAATDALLQTGVNAVQQKIEKLCREGGTLKFTTQAGTPVVGDVNFARFKPELTKEMYGHAKALTFTLEFECRPFFRGTPVQLADHAETTLPVCVGVDAAVGGDVPATVRLLVDEDQGVDQQWLVWGAQSRYYDGSATAALFYEAEGRTLQNGATVVTQSGSSGGGASNAVESAGLSTFYRSILSTQATGSGAHLSHVGTFRVFARVLPWPTNTGVTSVALEWSEGDFREYTRNVGVSFDAEAAAVGTFRIADLGLVHLAKVVAGTQRWEGRILADSTVAGDLIRVDYIMLVPVDEGSGEVRGSTRGPAAPTALSAADGFDQTAGNLTGKSLATGGAWTFSDGDTDDFTVDTANHFAQRTAISDTAHRLIYAATPTFTSTAVQIDFNHSGGVQLMPAWVRLLLRWVDASNYAYVTISPKLNSPTQLALNTVIGGVLATVGSLFVPTSTHDAWWTLCAGATSEGLVLVWLFPQGTQAGAPVAVFHSPLLRTGSTLASGKVGFGDYQPFAAASTRQYDNFAAWPYIQDAAVFASQSLELRSDRIIREDSGGTLWQRPSSYEGDYPLVPPAGRENRAVRFIVKACRQPPELGDAAIDDLSFRATVTPRYLVLPG